MRLNPPSRGVLVAWASGYTRVFFDKQLHEELWQKWWTGRLSKAACIFSPLGGYLLPSCFSCQILPSLLLHLAYRSVYQPLSSLMFEGSLCIWKRLFIVTLLLHIQFIRVTLAEILVFLAFWSSVNQSYYPIFTTSKIRTITFTFSLSSISLTQIKQRLLIPIIRLIF